MVHPLLINTFKSKKKLLLLLFLIAGLTNVIAQVKPIYFYGDKIISVKERATSYAFFGKVSDQELWTIKRFNLYNDLEMTGSYKDSDMKISHGKFTYYEDIDVFNDRHHTYFKIKNKYRFVSQMGSYIDGEKNGVWLEFYPDGKVQYSEVYLKNKLNGTYTSYDKKGKILITGNYINGIRDGEWLLYGGLQKDIYEMGFIKSSVKDEKLSRKEYYVSID